MITRRKFLSRLLVLPGVFITGCAGNNGFKPPAQKLPQPDFILSGNETEMTTQARKIVEVFSEDFNKPYRLRVFNENGEPENFVFQLVRGNLADYPYLRISRERLINNQLIIDAGNFLFRLNGLRLRIQVVDDQGNPLAEVPFSLTRIRQSASEWISLGIKVAAITFLIWAGAGIVKFIAGLIGFIAFNVMMIGILIFGAGLALEILRLTGINWDDIKRFVEMSIEFLVQFFRELGDFLESQF